MMMVENPCPQPTSATVAPRSSFATTPSRAGSHDADEIVVIAGAEEASRRAEQALRLIAPADALAGAKRGLDQRLVLQHDRDHSKAACR